jgi:hypothetical protein
MNSESLRIADQLRLAFGGDPWHGLPLRELLSGVTSAQARSRPIAGGHSIWELVLHIDIYTRMAFEATRGVPMAKLYENGKDWVAVNDTGAGVTDRGEAAWTEATDQLARSAEQLARAIEARDDSTLQDIVPGREYDFYYLFHGIVQHSLYHAGQIAQLKRALQAVPNA